MVNRETRSQVPCFSWIRQSLRLHPFKQRLQYQRSVGNHPWAWDKSLANNTGLRLKKRHSWGQHWGRRGPEKQGLGWKTWLMQGGLCLGGLYLGVWSPLAPAQAQYVPPPGDPPKGSSAAAGSRSSCASSLATVLAPQGHVARASTTTLPVTWFVSAQPPRPYRIELSLYHAAEAGAVPQMLSTDSFVVEPEEGFFARSIPNTDTPLALGERYILEVAVACNLESPSVDHYFVTELDLVAPSPALQTALDRATSTAEQVVLYAGAGYWYDALALAETEQRSKLIQELATWETEAYRQPLLQVVEQSAWTVPDASVLDTVPNTVPNSTVPDARVP